MAQHVIYEDRFTLREGALHKLELYPNDMADFVKNNEPEVLSFDHFLDDDGETSTAVFVRFLGRLSNLARVMVLDRRGTGFSDQLPAVDTLGGAPSTSQGSEP